MTSEDSGTGRYRSKSWFDCLRDGPLCDHVGVTAPRQNLWANTGGLNIQERRIQAIAHFLGRCGVHHGLDVGCGDGYLTHAISKKIDDVVGVEIDRGYISLAKSNGSSVTCLQGSIEDLPFRDNSFDLVCVSEVLEHLPMGLICRGITEVDRVLQPGGILVLSTPYQEYIEFDQCPLCGKLRPTNESNHLHSFDQIALSSLLPSGYRVEFSEVLPCAASVTCRKFFKHLPFDLWLPINKLAGLFCRGGTWLIMGFHKEHSTDG